MSTPYYSHGGITIYHGDAREVLRSLPSESVNCCVTSPPYWGLRDYGTDEQIGLEQTPEEYTSELVAVFREVRRILRDDGTLWLNLGDSYATGGERVTGRNDAVRQGKQTGGNFEAGPRTAAGRDGLKPKDLVGIPWRVAFALQADGWYLRQDIIWHKPNPMPESVTDRCTKAHEYVFLLSKSARYWYDAEAIQEESVDPIGWASRMKYELSGRSAGQVVCPGDVDGQRYAPKGKRDVPESGRRNRRSVWTVATQPYSGAHFAVFPPALILPCVLAGCPVGGTVLDPFLGSGTTAWLAREHGRKAIGIELNAEYLELAARRLAQGVLPLGGDA